MCGDQPIELVIAGQTISIDPSRHRSNYNKLRIYDMAACSDFSEFVFFFKSVYRLGCSESYSRCMKDINDLEASIDSAIRKVKKAAKQSTNSTGSSGVGSGSGGSTGSRTGGGLIDDKADDDTEKEEA